MGLTYLLDQIFSGCRALDIRRELEIMFDDLNQHVFLVFGVKRREANKHLISRRIRVLSGCKAYIKIPNDHQSAVFP
jgi:hypothetical protein